MDNYNKVAQLLSYGLTKDEILRRVNLSRATVNTIIRDIRQRFFEDENNGYTLTITENGTPKKVAFSI